MPMPSEKPLKADVAPMTPRDPVRRQAVAADLGLLAEMREHLRTARPSSGNEALRLLRAAYPDVPLADRVRIADEMNPAGF